MATHDIGLGERDPSRELNLPEPKPVGEIVSQGVIDPNRPMPEQSDILASSILSVAQGEYDAIGNAQNEYDAIGDRLFNPDKSALKQSQFVAKDLDPDHRASVIKIADQMKVNPNFVERNFDRLSKRREEDEYDQLIQNNPSLSKWLEDHNNLAVSKDDLPNLRTIEDVHAEHSLLRNINDSLGNAFANIAKSVGQAPAVAGTIGLLPQNLYAYATGGEQKDLPEWTYNNFVTQFWEEKARSYTLGNQDMTASVVDEALKGNFKQATRSAVVKAANSIPLQMGMLSAAVAGFPVTGLLMGGYQQTAQSAEEGAKSSASPLAQEINALASGSYEVLFERMGTLSVLEKWSGSIAKRVGRDGAGKIMSDFFKTILASSGVEASEEALTQVAQELSDKVTGVQDRSIDQIIKDGIEAGVIAIPMGATTTGPVSIMSGVARAQELRQLNLQKDFYLSLGEASAKTKLKERLPEAQQKLVSEITKHGPVENVFISPLALETYFQDQKIPPSEGAAQLGIIKEYTAAKEAGTDIKVPLSEWTTKVVGSEAYKALANDVKFSEDSLSINEHKQVTEQVKAEMDRLSKGSELDAQAKERAAQIQKQLEDVGVPKDEAAKQATLYEARARVRGEVLGQIPQTPIQITREGIVEPGLAQQEAPIYSDLEVLNQGPIGEAYTKTAQEHFGLTQNIKEAGYITSDGKMLDLSGRHYSEDHPSLKGERNVDHRELPESIGAGIKTRDNPNARMLHFMGTSGAIRHMPETGGISLTQMPTNEQIQTLAHQYGKSNQSLLIDILDPNTGETISSAEVMKPTKAKLSGYFKKAFSEIPKERFQVFYQPNLIANELQTTVPIPEKINVATISNDSSLNEMDSSTLRKAMLSESQKSKRLTVINSHTDNPIIISKEGLKKSANMAVRLEQAIAIKNIESLVKNAIYLRSERDRTDPSSDVTFDYFYSPFNYDGKTYLAKMAVRDSKKGKNLYAIHAQEVSSPSGIATIVPERPTLSNERPDEQFISKADLLSQVNEARQITPLFQTPISSKEAALKGVFSGLQSGETGPRGQIRLGRGSINIDLLKNADRSTFLHETGHLWLFEMGEDYKTLKNKDPKEWSDIQKLFVENSETILNWLGAESFDKITREQNEQFARGFEAYLMEGKAPTQKLRKAFAAFKVWLIQVYRTLKGLNVELTDDVRSVFDRLLATDEEIRAAEIKQNMDPMFSDPVAAGMSEAMAKKYLDLRDQAREEAEKVLLEKAMKDITRKQMPEYKAAQKEITAQVSKEADDLQLYKAMDAMKNNEEFKLSKEFVDKDLRKKLPRNLFAKEGGLHPNVIAESFGFSSAGNMFFQILGAEPKSEYIKRESAKRLAERFPDFLNSDAMREEAMQVVHNDKRAELLRMELEWLGSNEFGALKKIVRAVAKRPPSQAVIRAQADGILYQKQVKEINPKLYLAAERKHANEAAKQLSSGNIDQAFESKRLELLNHELYKASLRAEKEVETFIELARKTRKSDEDLAKTRDTNYVNAARALLAQVGLGRSGKTVESYLAPIKAYAPDQYASISVLIQSVVDNPMPFREMKFDSFMDLKDSIQALWDLSKSEREFQIGDQKLQKEDVINELLTAATEVLKPKAQEGYNKTKSAWDKSKAWLMSLNATLTRVEHWVDAMDVGNFKGAFRKYIYQPIVQATANYRTDKVIYIKKFRDLLKPIEKTLTNEKIEAPEINFQFKNKAELLGALLHTGNESNLQKLLRGRNWGTLDANKTLDTSRWSAFLNRAYRTGILTKADYDFVQGVWDLMEELKPLAQKAHKRVYGYYFSEVTANAIQTPFGEYRGGYFPARADSNEYTRQDAKDAKELLDNLDNSFGFPSAGRGATIKRIEIFAAPLQIDLQLAESHIDWALRFAHIQPAAHALGSLLIDRKFTAQMDQLDPTVINDLLVPWAQRAARQMTSKPSETRFFRGLDAIARVLRQRTAMQFLGMSMTNAIQNFANIGPTLLKVKGRHLRDSLWNYMTGPKEMERVVSEKSTFMKNRLSDEIILAQSEINRLVINPSWLESANEYAKKHAYILSKLTQNAMDLTTWWGAYNQSIEEGLNEPDAVLKADSAVRMTQGSQHAEDISGMEISPEYLKPFYMFAGFWNNLLNLNKSEVISAIRESGLKKSMPRLAYVYMMGYFSVAVLSELVVRAMAGKLDEDDDDSYLNDVIRLIFGSQVRQAGAFVPLAGPTVVGVIDKMIGDKKYYSDSIKVSPIVSALESASRVPQDVINVASGEDVKKKDIRDTLTLLGLITGFPAAPLGRPIGYLMDVSSGEKEVSGPIDFVRGLASGK